MAKIPVAVLTGFLGSGKTTVLKHLSETNRLARTLVLVNEFGEVGLDHQLLMPIADDTLVAIDSGCICCTIRSDLAETLTSAPTRYARGGVRWFDQVVIETTGIADPAPVLQTILGEAKVAQQYDLAGVITTVDAINGLHSIQAHPEAMKQIAVADRILLTKTDLASGQQVQPLLNQINELAPSAPVSPILNGVAQADWLFAGGTYALEGKNADVERWLHGESDSNPLDDHAHVHDRNRHRRIQASVLTINEPVDAALFESCLAALLLFKGSDLLRVKGIVNVLGMDRPIVFHGVQHVFHPPEILNQWPDEDHRTRIVFIAQNLDHKELQACFAGIGLATNANPIT